jgi:hypothetical protein
VRNILTGLFVAALLWSGIEAYAQVVCCRVGAEEGSSGTLTAENFSYDGDANSGSFRVNGGQLIGLNQLLTGRRVGGVNRVMITGQTEGATDYAAPVELEDPVSAGDAASYSISTTVTNLPLGALVQNWGKAGVGNAGDNYDFWGSNKFCYTYDSDGDVVEIASGASCLALGSRFKDDGTGTCCYYTTYSINYGNYPSPALAPWNMYHWNGVFADLQSNGDVDVYGPFRMCAGSYDGVEVCGATRALSLFEMPDGSMGHGSASTNTQGGSIVNAGPSFLRSAAWPQRTDDLSFGSNRNASVNYRTTDIQPTHTYITHGPYAFPDNNGDAVTTPITTFRRTRLPDLPSPGNSYSGAECSEEGDGRLPYCYEGRCTGTSPDHPNAEVDPARYENDLGTWTITDAYNGQEYIRVNGKDVLVVLAEFCTGHTWYSTSSDTTCQRVASEITAGGGPHVCPRHEKEGIGGGITGPVCSHREPVLLLYDPADLPASPIYSAQPFDVIYLQRELGLKHVFQRANNDDGALRAHGRTLNGLWWEPTESKLYFGTLMGDYGVTQFGEFRPVIHALHVTDSPPDPLLVNALGSAKLASRLESNIRKHKAMREQGIPVTYPTATAPVSFNLLPFALMGAFSVVRRRQTSARAADPPATV